MRPEKRSLLVGTLKSPLAGAGRVGAGQQPWAAGSASWSAPRLPGGGAETEPRWDSPAERRFLTELSAPRSVLSLWRAWVQGEGFMPRCPHPASEMQGPRVPIAGGAVRLRGVCWSQSWLKFLAADFFSRSYTGAESGLGSAPPAVQRFQGSAMT